LAERLAQLIANPRNSLFVIHTVANILRPHMLAIDCGGACPRAGKTGPWAAWMAGLGGGEHRVFGVMSLGSWPG